MELAIALKEWARIVNVESTRKGTSIMKLVIIGGTGLIGSKLVTELKKHRHEAVPAAPDTGVNTLTGEGLAEVLQDAAVVVDVSNSPSFEEKAVMEFFTTSTRNLLKYAAAAYVSRLRVDVVKNCMTAVSSNDGEFETSTTTAAS